jgi:hypothetical protein
LLKGLPATPYLMFGGSALDPKAMQQLVADFFAPVQKELPALGTDGQAISSYVESIKKASGATTGQAFGWVVPKGALGQEAILQMVAINHGDAQAITAAQQEMFNSQQAFMNLFTPGASQPQIKMNFTPNAKTIEGVALNQFQTQVTAPAGKQTAQQMQMQQMMSWMYGPNGMNGYFGPVGNDKVVVASGTSDPLLTQLIASAKANQDNLSNTESLRKVKQQLPQNRMVEVYIALDQIATTVANYAKMFGMPVNFQMPANLEPVAISVATEGSAVRSDTYIPAQLVQSLVAAVQQTIMQMQGGAQPGGPAGL